MSQLHSFINYLIPICQRKSRRFHCLETIPNKLWYGYGRHRISQQFLSIFWQNNHIILNPNHPRILLPFPLPIHLASQNITPRFDKISNNILQPFDIIIKLFYAVPFNPPAVSSRNPLTPQSGLSLGRAVAINNRNFGVFIPFLIDKIAAFFAHWQVNCCPRRIGNTLQKRRISLHSSGSRKLQ